MNIKGFMKTLTGSCRGNGCINVFKDVVRMGIYARSIGCRVYRNGACYLWNDKEKFQMLAKRDHRDYWAGQNNWSYKKLYPERCKAMHSFLKRNFWSRLDKRSNVADLPCAGGDWTFEAARYAGFVDGYEYSARMVETARNNAARLGIGNVAFYQLDAAKEKIKKKYDHIMFLGLLTYIYDDDAAEKIIRNAADALKRGGT